MQASDGKLEHFRRIEPDYTAITRFLDWLDMQGILLCEEGPNAGHYEEQDYVKVKESPDTLLKEYFQSEFASELREKARERAEKLLEARFLES